MKSLCISYDGILDPDGQSQIVPYLRGLTKNSENISLISFEKTDKMRGNLNESMLWICLFKITTLRFWQLFLIF